MIIDFKMKAPIPSWEPLFDAGKTSVLELFPYLKNEQPTKAVTFADVIQEMDDRDIGYGVILGRDNEAGSSNEELYQFLQSPEAERFRGFIGLENMTINEAVETIHRYGATGAFSGVTVNPAKILPLTNIDDPTLDPIFEACLAYDLPFCITMSLLISLLSDKPDYDYIHPKRLIPIAKKYPDLKLIVSHAAWPFVDEMIAVAIHFPNIFLVPDFYSGFPNAKAYFDAANSGLEDQVIFGSCYPNVNYDYALGFYQEYLTDSEIADKVFYANAAKLLGISE